MPTAKKFSTKSTEHGMSPQILLGAAELKNRTGLYETVD
jgi:hypothetical protein